MSALFKQMLADAATNKAALEAMGIRGQAERVKRTNRRGRRAGRKELPVPVPPQPTESACRNQAGVAPEHH